MVAEQLKIPPMTDRALPPVIVLISDGQPTDDFASGFKALMDQPWGRRAVRIAIAIGEEEHDTAIENLRADHAREVERLRADLEIATTEHEILFSRLHANVAEVVARTYELLWNYYASVLDYVKMFEPVGTKSKAERREVVDQAMKKISAYFFSRRIYFPVSTVDSIHHDFQVMIGAAREGDDDRSRR